MKVKCNSLADAFLVRGAGHAAARTVNNAALDRHKRSRCMLQRCVNVQSCSQQQRTPAAAVGAHRRGGTTHSSVSEVSPVRAHISAGTSQPLTASAATVFNRSFTGLQMLRAASCCKRDRLDGR
jgi:hypothetical protein